MLFFLFSGIGFCGDCLRQLCEPKKTEVQPSSHPQSVVDEQVRAFRVIGYLSQTTPEEFRLLLDIAQMVLTERRKANIERLRADYFMSLSKGENPKRDLSF
jgi:hypothetical protein